MNTHHFRIPAPGLALLAGLGLIAFLGAASPAAAQAFTIEQVLSPAFPYELVAARGADRIAWIEYERGMRNVYTAAAPRFEPAEEFCGRVGHLSSFVDSREASGRRRRITRTA